MGSGAIAQSPLGQLGKRVRVMEKRVVGLSLQVPGAVCVGSDGAAAAPAGLVLCPHLRTVGAH